LKIETPYKPTGSPTRAFSSSRGNHKGQPLNTPHKANKRHISTVKHTEKSLLHTWQAVHDGTHMRILQIGKQCIHVQLFKKSFPSLLPILQKQYRQAMQMYSQLALAGDSPKPRKRQRRPRSKAAKLRIASTASVHTLCGSAAPAAAVMKNYHHNLTLKMKHCAA